MGEQMKATETSIVQAMRNLGGAQAIADELNQLLRDVRVLQAVVTECQKMSAFGNLKTTELFEKARNSGALTRWGGGGR